MMAIAATQQVLDTLDQIHGFWGFMGFVYEQTLPIVTNPAAMHVLALHRREIARFSEDLEQHVEVLEQGADRQVVDRLKSRVGKPELGTTHGAPLRNLLEWCAACAEISEKVLAIGIALSFPEHLDEMLRIERVRARHRRHFLEELLAAYGAVSGVARRGSTHQHGHLLLVQLGRAQEDAAKAHFIAQGIPAISAAGVGEALFRIIQDRPALVLVGADVPGAMSAIVNELSLSTPFVPALTIHAEMDTAALSRLAADALAKTAAQPAR